MAELPTRPSDSQRQHGGAIPGEPGGSAFSLTMPRPSALPVLIAVPHAGRVYPGAVIDQMRNPAFSTLKLEDRYADRLGEAVARETGAALLLAYAPRAMIDLNRAADDVDWEMIARDQPDFPEGGKAPGLRVRSGLGLIPRRLPGIGELWRRQLSKAELAERIGSIHEPYHACLAESLAQLRARWGAALLLDLHSMPPISPRGAAAGAEFVLGDRFGASCHGALVASCFGYFAHSGRKAAHNRPYAGGYVLERHAKSDEGLHALQLEVDRTSYLDSSMAEPGPGFAPMVTLLSGLVRCLAAEVADLGHAAGRAEAAE
jgi:N-formylglutamate amidohydrolase